MTTYGCFNICLSKTILSITIHTIAYVAAVLFQRCQYGVVCAFRRQKDPTLQTSKPFSWGILCISGLSPSWTSYPPKTHQIQVIMSAKKLMLSVPYYAVLLGCLWRGRSEKCFFNMWLILWSVCNYTVGNCPWWKVSRCWESKLIVFFLLFVSSLGPTRTGWWAY